ncbi:hypothetical protein [Variovorax boronicumulans]|uniref:hypothetical protein n=1 Tax=Variovorax boronicumulans TaxID=436515 RepID=UPI0033998AE0
MNHSLLFALRSFFSLVTLVAIGWQLSIHVRMGFDVVNFFSYFTNLSNLFAAFVLLLTAFRYFSGRATAGSSDRLRAVGIALTFFFGGWVLLALGKKLGSLNT